MGNKYEAILCNPWPRTWCYFIRKMLPMTLLSALGLSSQSSAVVFAAHLGYYTIHILYCDAERPYQRKSISASLFTFYCQERGTTTTTILLRDTYSHKQNVWTSNCMAASSLNCPGLGFRAVPRIVSLHYRAPPKPWYHYPYHDFWNLRFHSIHQTEPHMQLCHQQQRRRRTRLPKMPWNGSQSLTVHWNSKQLNWPTRSSFAPSAALRFLVILSSLPMYSVIYCIYLWVICSVTNCYHQHGHGPDADQLLQQSFNALVRLHAQSICSLSSLRR